MSDNYYVVPIAPAFMDWLSCTPASTFKRPACSANLLRPWLFSPRRIWFDIRKAPFGTGIPLAHFARHLELVSDVCAPNEYIFREAGRRNMTLNFVWPGRPDYLFSRSLDLYCGKDTNPITRTQVIIFVVSIFAEIDQGMKTERSKKPRSSHLKFPKDLVPFEYLWLNSIKRVSEDTYEVEVAYRST